MFLHMRHRRLLQIRHISIHRRILMMNLLLNRLNRLIRQLLVLEQERQFLQRSARRLGVHEVDENELEGDPAAVDGEVFPVDCAESYGVHVIGEESADFTEDLLDSYAAGSLGVGEEFD